MTVFPSVETKGIVVRQGIQIGRTRYNSGSQFWQQLIIITVLGFWLQLLGKVGNLANWKHVKMRTWQQTSAANAHYTTLPCESRRGDHNGKWVCHSWALRDLQRPIGARFWWLLETNAFAAVTNQWWCSNASASLTSLAQWYPFFCHPLHRCLRH